MAIHAFIDFDGTVSQQDVGDELIRTFGAFEPLHSELLAGRMNVAEYYQRAVSTFTDQATPESVEAFAGLQQLDAGAKALIAWFASVDIPCAIVSDGFDTYITPLMSQLGKGCNVPVFCNKLVWNGSAFTPLFPGATESCSCFCASCKRNAILTNIAVDDIVIYIGDGRSDACAVQHADVVFAKGTLAAYCTAQGIPYHHYRTLSDVLIILQTTYKHLDFRPRRQAFLARKHAFEVE